MNSWIPGGYWTDDELQKEHKVSELEEVLHDQWLPPHTDL